MTAKTTTATPTTTQSNKPTTTSTGTQRKPTHSSQSNSNNKKSAPTSTTTTANPTTSKTPVPSITSSTLHFSTEPLATYVSSGRSQKSLSSSYTQHSIGGSLDPDKMFLDLDFLEQVWCLYIVEFSI